jgi:carbonic anhydrase/acetyltransferase-like protein (isoleucine patch superfamily)
MKKYELTNETINYCGRILYRIKALKDFNDVKKGDFGGHVQNENNLSQNGDCWVYYNAKVYHNAVVYGNAEVYGNAKVYHNAVVYGNAEVYGNARVSDNARVYGNARVSDNARVSGNARVYRNAKVYGNAEVSGDAEVYGNAEVSGDATTKEKVIIFGNAFEYTITITDNHIQIGCKLHTKAEWYNFTDKEIIEMDGKKALRFWKMFKPLLKQLGHLQDDKKIKIAELKAELAELEAENE